MVATYQDFHESFFKEFEYHGRQRGRLEEAADTLGHGEGEGVRPCGYEGVCQCVYMYMYMCVCE